MKLTTAAIVILGLTAASQPPKPAAAEPAVPTKKGQQHTRKADGNTKNQIRISSFEPINFAPIQADNIPAIIFIEYPIPKLESEPDAAADLTQDNTTPKFTGVIQAVFAGLLAIVGAFQAWILHRQRTIMSGQFTLLRNSERIRVSTERAYVFQKEMSHLIPDTDESGHLRQWMFFPLFQNSGATPTKNMTYHINISTYEATGAPEDTDFADLWAEGAPQQDPPTFLGPKAEIWGTTLGMQIVDLWSVWKGSKRIFMWGWIDYNDIFPDTPRHRTEFCHEVIVIGDPKNPAHISFKGHRTFNGADDECHHRPKPYVHTHM